MTAAVRIGLNVFNEAAFIEQTLREIYPYAGAATVADGAYAAFPYHGRDGASDDGTLELLRGFPDPEGKITLLPAPGGPWESEIAKLNAILARCPAGEWHLRIDPDERLTGDPAAAFARLGRAAADVAGIPLRRVNGQVHILLRGFRRTPDLRYGLNHWRVFRGAEELTDPRTAVMGRRNPAFRYLILHEILLVHQPRDEARTRLKRSYYADPAYR